MLCQLFPVLFHVCSLILASVIFQKRGQFGNPSSYFVKTWNEYKTGFDSNGELWLGLDRLHTLTSVGTWRLDVVMGDWDNQTYNARYNQFRVGSEATGYNLTIGSFDISASTLDDSLTRDITEKNNNNLNGMKFSTTDVDNDLSSKSCSNKFASGGGWWYRTCFWGSPMWKQ